MYALNGTIGEINKLLGTHICQTYTLGGTNVVKNIQHSLNGAIFAERRTLPGTTGEINNLLGINI